MTAGAPEPPDPASGRDPGLQPERTRLAWRRTTLTCTVVAVLAVRRAIHRDGTGAAGAPVVAGLVVLVWLGFLAVAHRRVRALATAIPPGLPVRGAVAAAACAVLLALCAVAAMV
ncbi:DUF202 domain-containing protein [Streptomyces sp. NPDC002018]|uniref:DUF202 domain-containing protein n=1 Tax=Streptomyces sp. NPDC002018 TaxID=3364629 RepID=UPI0036AB490E